jgi:hypothetical protein
MDTRTVTVMTAAAEAIHASARAHKRAEAAHKREARRLMQALSLLRGEAARLGIRLEITETSTERESHSDAPDRHHQRR